MSDTKDLLKMVMKWLLVPGPKRKKYSELTNEDSDYSKHIFQTVNTKPIGTNHFYGLQRRDRNLTGYSKRVTFKKKSVIIRFLVFSQKNTMGKKKIPRKKKETVEWLRLCSSTAEVWV